MSESKFSRLLLRTQGPARGLPVVKPEVVQALGCQHTVIPELHSEILRRNFGHSTATFLKGEVCRWILSRIQYVVIVYMENRSFDHVLGYLNLPGNHLKWQEIHGIYEAMNYYTGFAYPPHPLTTSNIDPDPPHERENVAIQINSAKKMQGFADSYVRAFSQCRRDAVMEYCGPKKVYVTDFLASIQPKIAKLRLGIRRDAKTLLDAPEIRELVSGIDWAQ